MTVDSEDDLEALKRIGRIVADAMHFMASKIEPGITTKELDDIGRHELERFGARSAPELIYQYPGATCISVNECVAHGIPDETKIQPGDMVNIDVSAELEGFFGDTGASFLVQPSLQEQVTVCTAAKKARNYAIKNLKAGSALNSIGKSVEKIARKYDLKIIRNLTSHGIGRSLHEDPKEIPSYYDHEDKRVLKKGSVITVEPFLSTHAEWAVDGEDTWSLYAPKGSYTAQYEHTIIITQNKPIITTVPSHNYN